MKVEMDFFFNDPRFLNLSAVQRVVYLALWGWAVQKRRERLKPIEVDPKFMADRMRIDVRSIKIALGVCDNFDLIIMHSDKSLTVVGVADKHPRLHGWVRDDVPTSPPLQGERERERESQRSPKKGTLVPKPADGHRDRPTPPVPKAVFAFDADLIRGPGEGQWLITEKLHDSLSTAYPDLTLLSEYRKTAAWLETNPTKRKTRRGMPRFIRSWIDRAQNSYRGADNAQAAANQAVRPGGSTVRFTGWNAHHKQIVDLEEADRKRFEKADREAGDAEPLQGSEDERPEEVNP